MCLDHHTALDMGKTNAFLGLPSDDIEVVRAVGKVNRGDPEALIQFLIENYPITTDRKYFEAQIAAMLRTNALFAETIKYLNGEFCLELKTRYQKAAVLALVFNKKLRELTPPPFVLPPLLTS
ncbi:hypothetical protein A2617_02020 [Candidatus Daviesbacteria bacterium RIFOXYD1_FULL_41_10]|nr:MAG: hypothetical protein A2617_02020 [Candidatus Daviesbacteria bacterium RIFOXYD1_FULL_41_10]